LLTRCLCKIQESQSGLSSELACPGDFAVRFDAVAGSRQAKPQADTLAGHRREKQIKRQSAFADIGKPTTGV
jgi:hypothetical protein